MKHLLVTVVALFWGIFDLCAQNETKPVSSGHVEVTIPFDRSRGVVISGANIICKGNETILKVEGDYESFEWNTGTTGRLLHVKEAGIYEVTVRTKGGCSLTGAVNVQVVSCI
jgi:hypothetical protein